MDEQLQALRAGCSRFLSGDGYVSPADQLAVIPPAVLPDNYGEGGVVAELEAHTAQLLGKPSAVFLPSGTMAQGAALRVHADARGRRTVLWHPQCHLDAHEGQAHNRLHQLTGRPVGDRDRLLTLADLTAVAEQPAAVLWKLPQRDLGGQLPDWEDLQAQTDWAATVSAARHLDGARLWEASAGYGRSPAEIAGLFDSVYVSFYKGIGALPGCVLAGDEPFVAQVREWRRRLGGTLYGMWPAAASALALLEERLGEMPARLAHARAITAALASVPGVQVVPNPPQSPMMHLLLAVSPAEFTRNARQLAEQQGLWSWPEISPTADPFIGRVELAVGRASCALTPETVAEALTALVAPAPAP